MARKTKEEAQETRLAILDAAELVFHEHGVSRTTLDEIAKAAGVTRGAVYWHFTNKAALFDALIERLLEPLDARLNDLQSGEGNPVNSLRELTLYFFDRLVKDPSYYRILEISWHKCEYVGEMAAIRAKHIECGNRFLVICEEHFRLAKARGYVHASVNPFCAAVGMMAVTDGLIQKWTLEKESFSLERLGPQILDIYLNGLLTALR